MVIFLELFHAGELLTSFSRSAAENLWLSCRGSAGDDGLRPADGDELRSIKVAAPAGIYSRISEISGAVTGCF